MSKDKRWEMYNRIKTAKSASVCLIISSNELKCALAMKREKMAMRWKPKQLNLNVGVASRANASASPNKKRKCKKTAQNGAKNARKKEIKIHN